MIAVIITDCERLNPSLPMSLINCRPTTQSELLDPLSLSHGFTWSVSLYPPTDKEIMTMVLLWLTGLFDSIIIFQLSHLNWLPFRILYMPTLFWVFFFVSSSASYSCLWDSRFPVWLCLQCRSDEMADGVACPLILSQALRASKLKSFSFLQTHTTLFGKNVFIIQYKPIWVNVK